MSNLPAIKGFLNQDNVKNKFAELLGSKSQGFLASVLQVVSGNDYLAKADQNSIYTAAMMAATLDLPINNNLGFAYIVPYKQQAQFQLGYKGFIQLAQRTGKYKTISATEIYEGQIVSNNPLTGIVFDFDNKQSDKVVGYCSYFSLLNGFEKQLYMTVDEIKKHSNQYSQSAKKGYGVWKDNFNAMAIKTVLKLLLSKYAPLSIEMEKAVLADQAVIKGENEFEYADNYSSAEVVVEKPLIALGTNEYMKIKVAVQGGNATVEQALDKYDFTDEALKDLRND